MMYESYLKTKQKTKKVKARTQEEGCHKIEQGRGYLIGMEHGPMTDRPWASTNKEGGGGER
jgi:hypothetical protein